MSIRINVLPEIEKRKRKEEERMGFALKLVISSIAVLLLINAMFLIMRIILSIELNALKKASVSSTLERNNEEENLEDIFSNTNKQVNKLQKIRSNIPNWARVLVRISELCPAGIKINNLSVENNRIKISGFSKTRNEFLDFQKGLTQEGFNFEENIANLTTEENFNFEFNAEIPQEYLVRK